MEGVFTLSLRLCCSATGEQSEAKLSLKAQPLLGIDLKREIELEYEIPVFTQTLIHELLTEYPTEIADDEPVGTILRNGDFLRVTYSSKAECKDIKRAVECLDKLVVLFRENIPAPGDSTSAGASLLNRSLSIGGAIYHLRSELFIPWRSSVKQTNKEVFIRDGGLEYLLELLRIVHTSNWKTSSGHVKVLEILLLETLHPLAAKFKLRRLLVKEGVIELCFKSLLRHKLDRNTVFAQTDDVITPYLLGRAMTTLCNLCELHQTHVKVGSNREVLDQVIAIACCSYYDTWIAQVVVNLLSCVAHAQETHSTLASADVLKGIINICTYRSKREDCGPEENMLMRYYSQLVFIQVVLFSPHHLSHESLSLLDSFMREFLQEVDPFALAKVEQSSGNFWSVFEPFVSLLYIPEQLTQEKNEAQQKILENLRHMSIHTAIIALHIILLCSEDGHLSLETMEKENLISFIICAPAHVPESLQSQAIELVRCLGRYKPINPPSLCDLTKASLAKYKFGLERMLHLDTPHQLVKEYYYST